MYFTRLCTDKVIASLTQLIHKVNGVTEELLLNRTNDLILL